MASIRRKVRGTASRPRLSVFRSNKRLYVQLIDDAKAVTLASAWIAGKSVAKASELGKTIAQKAAGLNIRTVVFDRSGYRYHGAIKAVADGVREGGITV